MLWPILVASLCSSSAGPSVLVSTSADAVVSGDLSSSPGHGATLERTSSLLRRELEVHDEEDRLRSARKIPSALVHSTVTAHGQSVLASRASAVGKLANVEAHHAKGTSAAIGVSSVMQIRSTDVPADDMAERRLLTKMKRYEHEHDAGGPAPDDKSASKGKKEEPSKGANGKEGLGDIAEDAVKLLVKQKKDLKMQHKCIAYILIGMVLLVTTLFYLTHSGDEYITGMTWRTLSDSLALFIAILIFFADKDVFNLIVTGEEGVKKEEQIKDGSAPDASLMRCSFLRLGLNYVFLMLALGKARGSSGKLATIGTLGAHVLAFSSADSFSLLQASPPFNSSPDMAFLVIPIFIISGLGIRMLGDMHREKLSLQGDGIKDEAEHEWEHQCAHTEDEILAFTTGLLISQFCRFKILGQLPPLYGYKKKKKMSGGQVHQMFCFAFVCGLIVVLLGASQASFTRGTKLHTLITSLQAIMTMAMAWNLHFWSKWLFYMYGFTEGGGKMVAKVSMALLVSPLGFLAIMGCDRVGKAWPALKG